IFPVAAAYGVVAVRYVGPVTCHLHLVFDRLEVGCPLDGVGDGGEENIGVAFFDMLHSRRDILQLLALVTPHQEHADANAVLVCEFDRAPYLLDTDTPLHSVQYFLTAALRAYP